MKVNCETTMNRINDKTIMKINFVRPAKRAAGEQRADKKPVGKGMPPDPMQAYKVRISVFKFPLGLLQIPFRPVENFF